MRSPTNLYSVPIRIKCARLSCLCDARSLAEKSKRLGKEGRVVCRLPCITGTLGQDRDILGHCPDHQTGRTGTPPYRVSHVPLVCPARYPSCVHGEAIQTISAPAVVSPPMRPSCRAFLKFRVQALRSASFLSPSPVEMYLCRWMRRASRRSTAFTDGPSPATR